MSGFPFMSNAEHARNIRIALDNASTNNAAMSVERGDGGGGWGRDDTATKYNRWDQIQSSTANDAAKWTLFDALKNAFASH